MKDAFMSNGKEYNAEMKRKKNMMKPSSQFTKPTSPLLEVKGLSVSFRQLQHGLRERNTQVIQQFDLTIHEGEIVAVVGASGSGKSILADTILGILPSYAQVKGTMKYQGQVLTEKKQEVLRGNEIFLIPQSVNALDPLMKSGKQVRSMIRKNNKDAHLDRIFEKVGLSSYTKDLYPFELSGGMARRVLLSAAFVSEAKLIIADEPTPGLDIKVLNETTNMMKELANEGKGMMFITHDITTALDLADKIAVVHAGEMIEMAKAEDFTGKGEKLSHPYTKALWNALPQNDFVPSPESATAENGIKSNESEGFSHVRG